jgi:hypothetical protein
MLDTLAEIKGELVGRIETIEGRLDALESPAPNGHDKTPKMALVEMPKKRRPSKKTQWPTIRTYLTKEPGSSFSDIVSETNIDPEDVMRILDEKIDEGVIEKSGDASASYSIIEENPYLVGDEGETTELMRVLELALREAPRGQSELESITGARRSRVSGCLGQFKKVGILKKLSKKKGSRFYIHPESPLYDDLKSR